MPDISLTLVPLLCFPTASCPVDPGLGVCRPALHISNTKQVINALLKRAQQIGKPVSEGKVLILHSLEGNFHIILNYFYLSFLYLSFFTLPL